MVPAAPKVENQKGGAYEKFVENRGREQNVSFATTRQGRVAQSMTVVLDYDQSRSESESFDRRIAGMGGSKGSVC